MPTYHVTIDVPAAPRLGSTVISVQADNALVAKDVALRLINEKWACGSPFRARTLRSEHIRRDHA